jgi:hypothetical protein
LLQQRSAYTISSATASPAATARNGRAKMNMSALQSLRRAGGDGRQLRL